MVLAGLILPFLPLLPIQVLLTNLIYDSLRPDCHWTMSIPRLSSGPSTGRFGVIERFMIVMGPIRRCSM